MEPSENFSLAELLLTELNPGKETTDASTQPGMLHPSPVAKEPAEVCPPGCKKELPFAYRRQEVLSPEVLSPAGFPLPGSTSHLAGEEEEEEEEERQGLHQLLVPFALLISDKPIIIRDKEGWDPLPEKLVL